MRSERKASIIDRSAAIVGRNSEDAKYLPSESPLML
jgi:hypothetical protein